MDKNLKIALIVTGAIVVASGLGFGIYFLLKKDTNNNQEELNPYVTNEAVPAVIENDNGYTPLFSPNFNTEGELTNSITTLKGQLLYPKEKALGGWDYANIRSSATVNTDQGWWDIGNKITTIYKGNPIGKVLSDTTTVLNGYSYRWFKIELIEMVRGTWSNHKEGFVRADTVTFKPIL